MRAYWDSSALVAATMDAGIRDRLAAGEGVTRSHALTELFSTLTGSRLGFRVDAADAALVIRELAASFEFVDLSSEEVLQAIDEARPRGVRGGKVHDYLHAVAARKADCTTVLTLNIGDFEGLFSDLRIEEP